jgi:hypothetical protein
MSNKVGMDIELVRSMGQTMQAKADELANGVVPMLDRLVQNIPAVWKGPDANMFRDWWTGQHRTHLLAVAHDLRGLGQSALNNAHEQLQASGVTGGGIAHSQPGDGGPGNGTSPSTPPSAASPFMTRLTTPTGDQLSHEFTAVWKAEPGSIYDKWGFEYNAKGDCTSYVAWRMNDLASASGLHGWTFDNTHVGGALGYKLGDASTWGATYPHDQVATPGSVAWWSGGHVAVVRSVDPVTHAIVVEQSAYNEYLPRLSDTIAPGSTGYPTGFLHFLPGT